VVLPKEGGKSFSARWKAFFSGNGSMSHPKMVGAAEENVVVKVLSSDRPRGQINAA